ncbi:SRPBCC domain-containing protein [Streptomyces sp. NBC_01465]|uniref:SRPBCC domain-containing protein n=1 Tax=Streptomyces sp. NBC_01465 TaxID=2903878 RepID=UPI002E30C2C9|nr:SRPBCC domain-containing protein [Streptomyces sp. NBC_01465]
MSADRIECDTLIAASLERVWDLVLQPGFWLDEHAMAGVVAKEGDSMVVKSAEHGDHPLRVEKIDPPTYIAYRWNSAYSPDPVTDDNSTLVEFTLSREGDRTRLRVVESGFATLAGSEELRASNYQDHKGGWPVVIDSFRVRVERSSA